MMTLGHKILASNKAHQLFLEIIAKIETEKECKWPVEKCKEFWEQENSGQALSEDTQDLLDICTQVKSLCHLWLPEDMT